MKIAVLLSGGVDSSLALRLLRDDGSHQLTAYYLKIWLEDELSYLGDCPWETDLEYARAVCDQLGVPLQVISLQTAYQDQVVESALDELRAGRTPSPDIFCNQRIKFGEFYQRIDPDFEKIASGHYAVVEACDGKHRLKRSPDPVKDQTYFLSHLSQQQIARALFPIGRLTKREVRQLARDLDLPTRSRKDSQGICFLGKIGYNDFVKHHLGERPGDIVNRDDGRVLGRHDGYWFHTIGQRRGLGLHGGPWYVVDKDPKRNIVFVSNGVEADRLARRRFTISDVNWIAEAPRSRHLQVKVRHGPSLVECEVEPLQGGRWSVRMCQGDPGISPGQFGVLYDGEYCLGGGVIESARDSLGG